MWQVLLVLTWTHQRHHFIVYHWQLAISTIVKKVVPTDLLLFIFIISNNWVFSLLLTLTDRDRRKGCNNYCFFKDGWLCSQGLSSFLKLRWIHCHGWLNVSLYSIFTWYGWNVSLDIIKRECIHFCWHKLVIKRNHFVGNNWNGFSAKANVCARFSLFNFI